MNTFSVLTAVIYLILIVMWSFILFFYIRRLRFRSIRGQLISTLLVILSIDAFRTLFESLYFGAWYTALAGFLPKSVHTFLIRPEMVFIPKVFNVIAAGIVIIILLYRWLPQEEQEQANLKKLIEKSTLKLTNSNESLKREISHRKQAEKEIKNHAKNLDAIFESTPNILILVNDEGRVEMINHKGSTFFGKEKKASLGLLGGEVFNCLNLVDGQGCGRNLECSQCPVRTRVMSTLETGKVHTQEEGQMTFVLNNEETSFVLLISTDLLTLDGNSKVLLSLTDITERKNTENLLRKEQDFLQKAQKIGKIGTWELDIKKNKLLWTEENYKIFGIPIGTALTYELFLDCVHPDDREYVKENWKATFNKKPYDIEHRLKVNGKVKWVRQKAELEFNAEGEYIRGIGVAQDITEHKLAEAERSKLFEAIEQTGEAIVITCVDGSIQYTNPAFKKITGYSNLESFGKNPRFLKSGLQDDGFYKDLWDTILSGRRWSGKLVNKHKNGTQFISECSISPVKTENDSIAHFIWISKDITSEVEFEKRMEQAQKMESIGNLAGGIAHDFNNILFPIVGMSEMLLEDLPEDSLEYDNAKEIYTAGQRGSELVKQILAFSRQTEHKMTPVRIQQVLKEVLKLSRSIISTNIEIKQDIKKDCGLVMADPIQIHQITMNIITNAYHAVEETGGQIHVQLKEIGLDKGELSDRILRKGQYAKLTFSDNGCGISPQVINRIFEPYFTTKKKGKGTGLGLAVVYGIVKEHKGDIKINSEKGKGTTVNIYLPLMEKSSVVLSDENIGTIETGSEKILLVDDEVPIIKLEKQILERLGYRVEERTSSMDALDAFRANPDSYDLVISDLSMPFMTGVQLAEEIKKLKPRMPIVICTGFSEKLNEEIMEDTGIQDVLMKPVVKSEMARVIRKVLDESKAK